MDDSQPPLDLQGPTDGDTTLTLADYAQTAYLEYALSVVKGRALPDVSLSLIHISEPTDS